MQKILIFAFLFLLHLIKLSHYLHCDMHICMYIYICESCFCLAISLEIIFTFIGLDYRWFIEMHTQEHVFGVRFVHWLDCSLLLGLDRALYNEKFSDKISIALFQALTDMQPEVSIAV